ncbi:MAG: CrcB family protein [Pseudomonadota bacterium]
MIEKLLLVAAGGAIGAVLRFLSVGSIGRAVGEIAVGTLLVNVMGSFLMGLCAVLMLEKTPEAISRLAPFLMTGLFGGFTTFSAFSLDAFRFYEDGRLVAAAGYVGGSVVLSILALIAGIALARVFWV